MLAELSGGEADPKIFIAQVHTVRKYLQRMPNEPLHVIHLQVHNDLPQECECNWISKLRYPSKVKKTAISVPYFPTTPMEIA